MSFVTTEFKNIIMNNVIKNVFPQMNYDDQELLLNYLVPIINLIAITFNFDLSNTTNATKYYNQFTQNNNRDINALLLLLLPFINDEDNTKKKQLKSLSDLFISMENKVDINREEPHYLYTNIEYGRCIRDNNKATERPFSKEYLDHNYYLLCNTIRRCSNMLYINWIDVIPHTLDTYRSTKLYKDTANKFILNELSEWNPKDGINMNQLLGLSMDDIYNTIANDFYYSILRTKWTIYDVFTDVNVSLPMILVCNYLFELNDYENKQWQSMSINETKRFTQKWNEFIQMVYNNSSYSFENFVVNNLMLQQIAKSIIYTFDSNYDREIIHKAIEDKQYIPFVGSQYHSNRNNEIDNIDSDIEEIDVKLSIIENTLKTIHPRLIFGYIQKSIEILKTSFYTRYVLNEDGRIKRLNEFRLLITNATLPNGDSASASIKNLYNFSKSLISYTNKGKYLRYPNMWQSLNNSQKKVIIDRLNGKIPVMEWFNIGRYISSLLSHMFPDNVVDRRGFIEDVNRNLYTILKNHLHDYIFEALIIKGCLSYFEPNPEVTNESYMSRENEKRGKYVAEKTKLKYLIQSDTNKIWNKSYYFLTNTTWKNMDKFSYRGKQISYFDFNSEFPWYDVYALNWISQINFFHRYLNNRIIYVTGSTGVGKSTQIPKLLLYALKAIDYKNNGSIVCTQPRIAPTRGNAGRIAYEMGVPIADEDGKIFKNAPYYIQYKFKGGTHTPSTRTEHLSLRLSTDGSLLEEIKNPFFKRQYKSGNDVEYTLYNQYDIVIVDESHEHNKNMDLILTFMRNIVNYNNSVKLVIVSATMDADEPIYRRYYRDINDNRMYPLNMFISENKLDRINVDRRIHISPPGATTRFKITEEYLPNENPIELTLRIIKNNPKGDILFFQPGEREINETVESLNRMLPSNVIALPFYSRLDDEQKKIVENISKSIKNLRFDRQIPFSNINRDNISKGNNTYDRCVIVATNIAEASLTIDSLRFVIDTGKQKTAIYDYKYRGSKLEETYISESARLQRKGRVGRVASGNVYYIYPKGTTTSITKLYDISISNIYLDLFDRLANSNNDTIIINTNNDPNRYKATINLNSYQSSIQRIIKQQYYLSDTFYDYYGLDTHYDYKNAQDPVPQYKSGYDYQTLNDDTGMFYIIHPEEISLKRNIVGKIVALNLDPKINPDPNDIKLANNKIVSNKMMSFWKTLMDNLFISLNLNSNNSNSHYTKTKMGTIIQMVRREISNISTEDIDLTLIIMLMYAIATNQYDDYLKIICGYIAVRGNVMNMIKFTQSSDGRIRKDLEGMKRVIGAQRTDLDALLFVANEINRYMERINIQLDPGDKTYYSVIESIKKGGNSNTVEAKFVKLALGVLEEHELISKDTEFDQEKFKQEYEIIRKNDVVNNLIIEKINTRIDELAVWINSRSLDFDFVSKYLETYIALKNKMQVLMLDPDTKNEVLELIQIVKSTIMPYTNIDAFYIPIIFGYKYSIAKHITTQTKPITGTLGFIPKNPLMDDNYLTIFTTNITPIKKMGYYPNTTVPMDKLKSYVIYMTYDLDTIHCMVPIRPELIKYIGFVYSRDYCTKMFNETKGIVNNQQTQVIYKDTLSYHDTTIWNYLSEVYKDDIGYVRNRKNQDI